MLVAALGAGLGLLQDLDTRLSSYLSTTGARVVCTGVSIDSWDRLSVDRVQVTEGRVLIVMEDLGIEGALLQPLLPGPDRFSISSRRLSYRIDGDPITSNTLTQAGPLTAMTRLDRESVIVRAFRLGEEGAVAGGFDVSSGRIRRAHLSLRLDKYLLDRLAPLGAVVGGDLRGDTRLRLILLNGRLRLNGAQRPLLDLRWSPA